MKRVQIDKANACCGKEQPPNLREYAVQGRGATKPHALESPRTASLKPTLVLCLATVASCILYCCSVLLLLHVPHLRA